MQKSTSTKTSTSTKNGKTVKTTVKEETTIYPDGRKEVTTTTTVDEGGNISEEVSTSVSQGQVRDTDQSRAWPWKPSGPETLKNGNSFRVKANANIYSYK